MKQLFVRVVISSLYLTLLQATLLPAAEWHATVKVLGVAVDGAYNGSGSVIDATNGIVLTCAHTVSKDKKIKRIEVRVFKSDFSQFKTWPAKILSIDEKRDIAILKIDPSACDTFWQLAPNGFKVKIGDELESQGFTDGGRSASPQEHHVKSVTETNAGGYKLITATGKMAKGRSGGPLLHVSTGLIIGVISTTDDTANNAVSLKPAWEMVSQVNSYRRTLYYWSADWCEPCRRFKADLAADKGFRDALNAKYRIKEMNFDKHKILAAFNGIMILPTFWPCGSRVKFGGYEGKTHLARLLGLKYEMVKFRKPEKRVRAPDAPVDDRPPVPDNSRIAALEECIKKLVAQGKKDREAIDKLHDALSKIQSATGAQGIQGKQGGQGVQGVQGVQGPSGVITIRMIGANGKVVGEKKNLKSGSVVPLHERVTKTGD